MASIRKGLVFVVKPTTVNPKDSWFSIFVFVRLLIPSSFALITLYIYTTFRFSLLRGTSKLLCLTLCPLVNQKCPKTVKILAAKEFKVTSLQISDSYKNVPILYQTPIYIL